jgi:hypothetical protein
MHVCYITVSKDSADFRGMKPDFVSLFAKIYNPVALVASQQIYKFKIKINIKIHLFPHQAVHVISLYKHIS